MNRLGRWFRFYDETLNNRKAQSLPGDLFKHWVNILCIASKHGGEIPSLADVTFALRVSDAKAAIIIAALCKVELLDPVDGRYFRPHDWDERQFKSDVSNDRVKQHRERKRNVTSNVTEPIHATPPEAETDTEADEAQRSLTSSSIPNSLLSDSVENVKEKGWTPPKHCAVSRDRKRIYIQKDTPEWEAYSADFRTTHRQEPQPNSSGGKWFYLQGEAA